MTSLIFLLISLIKRLLSQISFRSTRIFTIDEVMKRKNDRWVIIDDDVYCLLSMKTHSGGLDIIEKLSGRDLTQLFYEIHLKPDFVKEHLNRKYRIGKIRLNPNNKKPSFYLKNHLIQRNLNFSISNEDCQMKEEFKQHVFSTNFPCLNAKIALKRNAFDFDVYDTFCSEETTKLLWQNLMKFINKQSFLWENNHIFTTYVACFRTPENLSEDIFEILLWKQLQQLHEEDVRNGMKWSKNYSNDPSNTDFAFSIGERGFFLVGLHPQSSRNGRRFSKIAIAFNSQDQFTNLRRLNLLTEIKQVVRQNDLLYNGSINPNVIENENGPGPFEYSGKLIQPEWKPNFQVKI
ncbi:unnamed protein product [Adineta ricciae]|uniref:Cytochrome b5 heme-binding domain-containing protein n=1 Tax=Adineta ricciae TaxID=249248 RepID=A0A815CES8_ADIRI|nr:unnamed protein product [Adineta ricciae]CAF1635445.1 unnamed protein product [Adineta ricciae]